jgi:hypothetical protein
MKMNNLFQVLVLGGALLSSQSGLAEGELTSAVGLRQVFCDSKDRDVCVPAIVDDQCGLAPKAGLACCWNTSCDSQDVE